MTSVVASTVLSHTNINPRFHFKMPQACGCIWTAAWRISVPPCYRDFYLRMSNSVVPKFALAWAPRVCARNNACSAARISTGNRITAVVD